VGVLTRVFGTFRPEPILCCERCRVEARMALAAGSPAIRPEVPKTTLPTPSHIRTDPHR
jgi:hypothetical protein